MAFKRALVVDDSRTARQSLAKLLAQYDLEVAFAETGEEALAFLHHELVDVIFMDHTMPGMDGLEAVSAIKGNPRTATIPVMMYTTKEGEVYVSQARALGAVGVLPKQVQPGVLYDMLNRLGLVGDRRRADTPPDADAPRRRLADLVDDVDREYEQRALGISVQTLVTRLLKEQHQQLRGEILTSQRRFAQHVAEEILRERPATVVPAGSARRSRWLVGASALLAAALVSLGTFTWHVMAGRDAARLEVARLTTATRNELDAAWRRSDGLAASVQSHRDENVARTRAAVEALEWSLDQDLMVAFDQPHFDDAAAAWLDELLARLTALGFRGSVVLTAELAPFCLTRSDAGLLELADPAQPVEACEVLGHPLQDAGSVVALQTIEFATVLDATAGVADITVALDVRQPFDALPSVPVAADHAGAWNRLAARSNRIRVSLIPSTRVVAGIAPR